MKLRLVIPLLFIFSFLINGIAQSNAKPKFVFKVKQGEIPKSTIWLVYNGKKSLIKTVNGEANIIEPVEYIENRIPKMALSAIGSWYAGSGDYFYVTRSGNKMIVYQAEEDEQVAAGKNWKKMKEL